jgi:hypothetical protein
MQRHEALAGQLIPASVLVQLMQQGSAALAAVVSMRAGC